MTRPAVNYCNSCGAPIFWSGTKGGNWAMPIDVEPVPHGNVILWYNWARDELTSETLSRERLGRLEPGRSRYVSHFETCTKNTVRKR